MTKEPLRKGTATLELAVTLPVILFFFLASVELGSRANLKQTATSAAYESARRAASVGGSVETATESYEAVMSVRNVQNSVIRFEPEEPWTRGRPITVTVQIPINNNLWVDRMFSGQFIESSVTFIRQ